MQNSTGGLSERPKKSKKKTIKQYREVLLKILKSHELTRDEIRLIALIALEELK
jgi:hypothetical protein